MVFIRDRDRRPEQNAGVYLGTVTRVTGTTCYVEVPRLAKGFEYGPAGYPSEYAEDDATADGHTHAHRSLAKGDRVAVAFLEGGRDDLVVLARLA